MIKVLFFGRLSDLVGHSELEVTWQQDMHTVAQLKKELASQLGEQEWSALAEASTLISVNKNFATDEMDLADGDEVAFMSPVTGG